MLTANWNFGWELAMGFLAALTGVGIIFAIVMGFMRIGLGVALGLGWAIVFGAIMAWVAFPFSGVYHRYQPVSGKVTQNVTSRFLGDGSGGTNQNYLVAINGNTYRCDDTRCSGLVKGDDVTLMCEKSYQFNATSGWVCNWGKLGLNN
jgi:hypothetical protein